jgi:spore coat polysaccharide biosynthesis protein SpsF|tara:strand:+ start:78 stop:773 length:696 start_codon:yes stop_codon:yes gene_type:complete
MKLKNLGCIIFARSNSKRLKKKVLREIGNTPLVLIVYSRVRKVFPKNKIVIATSKNKFDDNLVKICKKNNIKFFRGNLNNVFQRGVQCCKKFNLDAFMRVCSDRPFFYYELANKMKKEFQKGKYDIVTNVFPKTFPKGLTCEFIKFNTLKKVSKKNLSKKEQEHMINYFYRNSENFSIKNYKSKLSTEYKNLNLSIDNMKGLNISEKIFKKSFFNISVPTKTALKYAKELS